MKRVYLAILVLVLAMLACQTGSPERVSLFPSATPTVANTSTPIVPTQTPIVVVVSATPEPSVGKCVTASVAVHLRPSPSNENYPIMALPHGAEVKDLGGRDGNWMFVEYGDRQGWVLGDYVEDCE